VFLLPGALSTWGDSNKGKASKQDIWIKIEAKGDRLITHEPATYIYDKNFILFTERDEDIYEK
jgi:hypothetical protein